MEALGDFAGFMESEDVPVRLFLVQEEFLPQGLLILVFVEFPEINVLP